MNEAMALAEDLLDFIHLCPTAFHTVQELKSTLTQYGFLPLKANEKWILEKGGCYFTTINDSACIAFSVGQGEIENEGFKIIGAHTDSPTFKVKSLPEIHLKNYIKLNTEVYGSPILSTWMDRPLGLAGRISLRGDNPLRPITKLINIKRPLMVIPNLAIHMNRRINEGIELNKQKDTLPLLALVEKNFKQGNYLMHNLAEELGEDPQKIMGFELFLYEWQKGCITGLNKEFISASRLDDLAMVHTGLKAICNTKVRKGVNVLACFDNEEVGSRSRQGADSPFLNNVLERILLSLGQSREDYFRIIANSFLISADMAHAIHPNSPERNDPTNFPLINEGPVIKESANNSYTSDSHSETVFANICFQAGVPVQKFVNRSDSRGGSTIGPISSSHLSLPAVDVGNPLLAMHSIRETGGVKDHLHMLNVFKCFYQL